MEGRFGPPLHAIEVRLGSGCAFLKEDGFDFAKISASRDERTAGPNRRRGRSVGKRNATGIAAGEWKGRMVGWKWRRKGLKSLNPRREMVWPDSLLPTRSSRSHGMPYQRVDRSIARSASAMVSGRPTCSHRPSSLRLKRRPLAAAAWKNGGGGPPGGPTNRSQPIENARFRKENARKSKCPGPNTKHES
jgi:hypothetical protein